MMHRPIRTLKLTCWLGIFLLVRCLSYSQTHPSPAPATNHSYRLEITVTDENGVAVPSALVQLNSSPQAIPLRCQTDFAGRCEFANLPPQSFQLRIEKQGFYATVLADLQPQNTPIST